VYFVYDFILKKNKNKWLTDRKCEKKTYVIFNFFLSPVTQKRLVVLSIPQQYHQIKHRRICTSPSPFLYNQRSCCHEDTDPVREARLLRLRSKYLEPDSSSHQEPSFCSGFSQSSKDLFVFRDHLDTVMHYRSHCCR